MLGVVLAWGQMPYFDTFLSSPSQVLDMAAASAALRGSSADKMAAAEI